MTAEIVSTDAAAQQITVRKLSMGGTTSTGPADAPTFTLKVEGKALTSLSTVKSGDQVTISCKSIGDMGSTTSGTTGATTSGAGTASGGMGSTINSQAMADMHCSSVTDISPSKMTR